MWKLLNPSGKNHCPILPMKKILSWESCLAMTVRNNATGTLNEKIMNKIYLLLRKIARISDVDKVSGKKPEDLLSLINTTIENE